MGVGEDFLLKWNDHHSLFFAGAEELVSAEEYTDVTLAAGTRFFAAHRFVLSICSPYFRQLFKRLGGAQRQQQQTVIFLKDVEPKHLELLLEYMYKGEIKVEVGVEQCGGYGMFILDPNFSIPDPWSKRFRINIKVSK
jgi:hypothetical protein